MDDETVKCAAPMASGLTCDLAPHDSGDHYDKFGLRDPKEKA